MSDLLDSARILSRLAINGVVVTSAGSADADKLVKTDSNGLIAAATLGNNSSLTTHIADETKHLTSTQNALLDAITATAVELNYTDGVTSAIQTQLDAKASSSALTTHTSDATVHLTGPQNTLLDALTASATELNYNVGVTGAIQTQLDAKATATALNASNLTSGTVPDARFPATLPTASGVNLTALNASNLGSGTVPDARFPATLPAASGANLTALNASNLDAGTIPDARFPATLPALSGVNLTALSPSNITGAGTASQYLSGTGWTYGVQTPVSTISNVTAPTFTLATANTIFNSTESTTPYTITIPLNSSVAYPNGTALTFVQSGTSVITIAGAGGVTLVSHGSLFASDGVGSLITALKLDTNTWLVSGNLA